MGISFLYGNGERKPPAEKLPGAGQTFQRAAWADGKPPPPGFVDGSGFGIG